MTRHLDPARDDAGVRLRTARLRRGMTQIALAEMACVSASFVSMVETGQRELTRACRHRRPGRVLRVSPLYLANGWEDSLPTGQRPARTCLFPARSDPTTVARHQQFAAQFIQLARQDGRAAGTGCAAWPASPACIPGCSSMSSPRSCPTSGHR